MVVKEKKEEFVYRIGTAGEWEELQETGANLGRDIDCSSGFIHLSSLHPLGEGLIYEKVESDFFPLAHPEALALCHIKLLPRQRNWHCVTAMLSKNLHETASVRTCIPYKGEVYMPGKNCVMESTGRKEECNKILVQWYSNRRASGMATQVILAQTIKNITMLLCKQLLGLLHVILIMEYGYGQSYYNYASSFT